MDKLAATSRLLAYLENASPRASIVAARTAALLELESLRALCTTDSEALREIGQGDPDEERKRLEGILFSEKGKLDRLSKALSEASSVLSKST